MQVLYNKIGWHASLRKLPSNCIILYYNLHKKINIKIRNTPHTKSSETHKINRVICVYPNSKERRKEVIPLAPRKE
jgi:hypothetical protein